MVSDHRCRGAQILSRSRKSGDRRLTLAGRSGLRRENTSRELSGEQFFNFAPGELPLQPGTHLGHNAGGRMRRQMAGPLP